MLAALAMAIRLAAIGCSRSLRCRIAPSVDMAWPSRISARRSMATMTPGFSAYSLSLSAPDHAIADDEGWRSPDPARACEVGVLLDQLIQGGLLHVAREPCVVGADRGPR